MIPVRVEAVPNGLDIAENLLRHSKMKKAIVIGCRTNGLGVIRSLGLKNFHIIAMSYDRTDFAHASKYVHERVKIPHPLTEEREFIAYLVENSSKWKDALLLETNDEIAITMSKNRDNLQRHYKIATPEWHVLRRFVEKTATYHLAEKCNVPYPKTFLPKTLDELRRLR